MKKCIKCGSELPLTTEFYTKYASKSNKFEPGESWHTKCKQCELEEKLKDEWCDGLLKCYCCGKYFPEEELVQLLGNNSRRWKEGIAVTWEIINDLNNKLAKQSGIFSWAQAHAPEQKLWDFIDNTLKTPDNFIKYVKNLIMHI